MKKILEVPNNELMLGDCLNQLKKINDESIDLVYLDPPFFTQKKHSLKSRDNKKEYSFNDTWADIAEYSNYIKERIIECRRVLKKTGSIFLHCDRSASHYLRIALDEVFGVDKFQSEIVWAYKRWSNAKNGLLSCHQIIYFYSKTNFFKFNKLFEDYSPTTNIDQIFQKRMRDANGKTAYKKKYNDKVELIEKKLGVPLSDVWQIPYLNPKASERSGYPTQKPILLLERIISISTDIDDIVLDPFCGSGTTLVAAKLLNRKYVGIDLSEDAITLAQSRISNPIKSESNLLKRGEQAYLNQDDDIISILEKIGAVPVQRNKGIDGFLSIDGSMRPIPIKIQKKHESKDAAINSLLKASEKSGFSIKILILCEGETTNENYYERIPSNKIFIVNDINKFPDLKRFIVSNEEINNIPIASSKMHEQLT
ncbi:MAG: DNA methyltransferase [Coxiella sp. RIFCSPHIGHO2_12_FULL_42_15]|nr:MAG: DNA methyltransferase [Coxiella sp. RIFCSPHIGHO2_12_FULL_42_15]